MARYALLPDGTFCRLKDLSIVTILDGGINEAIEQSGEFIRLKDYEMNPDVLIQQIESTGIRLTDRGISLVLVLRGEEI